MMRLALWLALCAAIVPAQQLQITGTGGESNPDAARADASADNMVVMLPGRAVTLPPEVEPPPPPPAPPAAAVPVPTPPGVAAPTTATPSPAIPKSLLPADFERDSGFFCQKLIGAWTEQDAYNLLGDPIRRRPAFDSGQGVNGHISAYSDPTGRYRLLELDFAQDTGLLRTVFVYPKKLSWQDCRRLWGAKVQSTEANKGRTFYSYANRRLDVLVDATGNVISLGLY